MSKQSKKDRKWKKKQANDGLKILNVEKGAVAPEQRSEEVATLPVPEVSDVEVVLGGTAVKILPPYATIPEEFKRDGNKWVKVMDDWFFFGLKNAKWTPKKNVDTKKALRALKCCMMSFEPSHEHKTTGVAYLLSQWFTDVTYTRAKPDR